MQAFNLRTLASALRQYSTGPTALPEAAQVARTASTPLAVRLRRRNKFGPVKVGQTDANADGLSPSEVARYNRLKALGHMPRDASGKHISPLEWQHSMNERRSRIRGFKPEKREDGTLAVKVAGQRVYLPNIEFKLVRNHTPAGEPYNPYEATFRIPKSVTKTDIRSYLDAVYGVRTTYIRTDNYYGAPRRGRETPSHLSYKRAVVGLVDPFYYPHRLEDMPADKLKARKEWLEQEFAIKGMETMRRAEMLRQTIGHGSAAFRFKPENATRRSHILKLVTERKVKREALTSSVAEEMKEKRAKGERVSFESLAQSFRPPAPAPETSKSS